jgi:hypothetical protein
MATGALPAFLTALPPRIRRSDISVYCIGVVRSSGAIFCSPGTPNLECGPEYLLDQICDFLASKG